MSTELTLEKAALAWAQGKRVEATDSGGIGEFYSIGPVGSKNGRWNPLVFHGGGHRFRLAPEPPAKKWREWEFSEVPVGALTRHKECGGDVLMIVGKFSTGALLAGDRGMYPFTDLFRMREHSLDNGKTWLPCGVEVSE